MSTNKTYKSEVFEAVHETVVDMFDAGVIDKKQCGNLIAHV